MGNDHVNAGGFRKLRDPDLLHLAEMGDELERQVRRRLAGAALAYGVALDNFQLGVEIFEHGQALLDQILFGRRLALAVKQNRIPFDFGESKSQVVRSDDQIQQLVDDMRAVIKLGCSGEIREAADIRNEDGRFFCHGVFILYRRYA